MFRPMLLLRATTGSIVLLELESVLMSVACVTTKDLVDAYGLSCSMKSF